MDLEKRRNSFGYKGYKALTLAYVVSLPRFHSNWRHKAMERFITLKTDELVFTNPMRVDDETSRTIQYELSRLIEKIVKSAHCTEPENLMCHNIVWINLRAKR